MDIRDILEDMRHGQAPRVPTLNRKWIVLAIIVVVVLVALKTMIYTVATDSHGVVLQFGRYSRTTEPGIHLKLPFGMETAESVPVKKVQKEEFGFRTLKAGVDSVYLGIEEISSGQYHPEDLIKLIRESGAHAGRNQQLARMAQDILQGEYVMLTGDLNIVDVEWIVQYKIKNARDYLFNIRDPRQTIRDVSQAVMRQLIGNGSVDEAIILAREENQDEAEEALQARLDAYAAGIYIQAVQLQDCNPPRRVRPAFDDVIKAQQQKETRINKANRAYNEVIPKTRGEAQKLIETAKGYAAERVNEAEGNVARFAKIYEEYKKAPEITRQRMYLETMTKVLPLIPEKWILEQGGADGGILMKLDLVPGQ